MISQDLLKEARELIGGDRQTDYGDKLKNHQNIKFLDPSRETPPRESWGALGWKTGAGLENRVGKPGSGFLTL